MRWTFFAYIRCRTPRMRLRAVGIGAQTLSGVLIDHRQNPEPSPVHQAVTHKVHAPALVRKTSFWKRYARLGRSFASLLRSHLQPFLSIKTVHTLGIYAPTFSPQQHRQSSITVPDPHGC